MTAGQRSLGRASRRFWLVAAIGVFLAVVLAGASLLESRLGPIEPTDPGWKASVMNDLGHPIHVRNSAEDLYLRPGQSDIFVPSGPGQLNVIYTVTDEHGKPLGCLSVQLDKARTVDVKASQLKPCRT